MIETRLQHWGNSLGLRIPKTMAIELGLANNSPVELVVRRGQLMVTPARPTLESMLLQVTDQNRHAELSTGEAVGNEVW